MNIFRKMTESAMGVGNETEKGVPQKGIPRCMHRIGNHYGRILTVNYLCMALSMLIITIPAALSGMYSYMIKLYRDGFGMEYKHVTGEFKGSFKKSVLIGIPCLLLFLYGMYLQGASGSGLFDRGASNYMGVLGMVLSVLSLVFMDSCLIMNAAVELPVSVLLKNTALILLASPGAFLGSIAAELLYYLGIVHLGLYFLPTVLLGLWAIKGLFQVGILYPSVQKFAIRDTDGESAGETEEEQTAADLSE